MHESSSSRAHSLPVNGRLFTLPISQKRSYVRRLGSICGRSRRQEGSSAHKMYWQIRIYIGIHNYTVYPDAFDSRSRRFSSSHPRAITSLSISCIVYVYYEVTAKNFSEFYTPIFAPFFAYVTRLYYSYYMDDLRPPSARPATEHPALLSLLVSKYVPNVEN